MRDPCKLLLLFLFVALANAAAKTWTLDNGWIRAGFQLDESGHFRIDRIQDLKSQDVWQAAANKRSSSFRLRVDDTWFGADAAFRLIGERTEDMTGGGTRQIVVLQDLQATGEFEITLEVYPNQPVLRYGTRFRNLKPNTVFVKWVNMVPWALAADTSRKYIAFRVNQWTSDLKETDFDALQTTLDPGGKVVEVNSGAHGQQYGWLVVRDTTSRGLFTGWEFDGRARTTVREYGAQGYLQFASNILDLNHPVLAGESFEAPYAFLGLFHGDWDEAGYRTQRFMEAVLAKAPPDPQSFPYVGWDSWAYQTALDEDTLRHNAEMAAKLGFELFTVDLGWASRIGDWHADPAKFPSGLRALSDYVHSLGMRFGLHFALAEAAPESPVLQENPDWTSSQNDSYFGANSLCLSNRPAREWLIGEALRIIDEYNPDWLLQDGENMVKTCTKTTHTHDPADSNYSNAVDGLNAVIETVQKLRPNVYWENCENGGNMMTFKMVRNYVTSITNDASGSLGSRRAAYGATYPFSPRYADRYMPEQTLDSYVTHSYLFGGPWMFMDRLPQEPADQLQFAAEEIAAYKRARRLINRGKVFHLTPAPAEGRIDALESYDEESDAGLVVVTRAAGTQRFFQLRPRGLRAETRYGVTFESDSRAYTLTGAQLMLDGVRVELPGANSSEIVHIDPLN